MSAKANRNRRQRVPADVDWMVSREMDEIAALAM